jgi:hypothetical protein
MNILVLSSNKSANNEVILKLIEDFGLGADNSNVTTHLIDPATDWIVVDDTLNTQSIKLINPKVPVASKIVKIYSNYKNLKLRELFSE